jgi:hypothetical protein
MRRQEATVTDKAVARRTKRWGGRGSAIRYRWSERAGDWWCATRDARSGLAPAASATPPALQLTTQADDPACRVWATPRIGQLGQLGRGRAEQEWIRYQAEISDLQIVRARAAARGEAARERREVSEKNLEALGENLSKEAVAAVAAGEENAPDEVRIGRRHREHAARRQALRAEIEQSRTIEQEAAAECAGLDEQVRIRHDVARVRVAMIEAYVRRRCSAYLARLVRKHPDGERIGALLRSAWTEQPSWLAVPQGDAW